MGYYFVGLFPMFSNCIELSSDDEVQIVEDIYHAKNSVVWKTSNTNAIEKLSRNSNIELTINLEDFNFDDNSSKREAVPRKNGVIEHRQNTKNRPSKEDKKRKFSNGYKSDSSDVEIIDIIEPKSKTGPLKENKTTLVSSLSRSQINSPMNTNFTSACTPPLLLTSSVRNSLTNKNVDNTPINGFKKRAPLEYNVNTHNNKVINSVEKISFNQKSQSTTTALRNDSQKSPCVNIKSNDVVYIIDDDKSDEERSFSSVKPISYTEALPKPTQTKKRANPDNIISSIPVNFQETSHRVTRSSLSLPPPAPLKDSAEQSTSKSKSNSLSIMNEPMNKYSIENMFSGLVKICKKIFVDETLEAKLWRTFKQASEQVLRSEEFINALKMALKTSEESKIESLDDKLLISREIKEVMRIMKRHPAVVEKKVKKLSHMLNLIRSRIRKLEEAEVTSDEEEENSYVLLDRYRTRATKIYEKLCELQKIPSDAGRIVRQKLSFTGNTEYPKIEKAIEKFYLKTKSFPDFFDVKTLVEKTVKKEDLDIPPYKIHNIAQSLFVAFGNKLKRMRCCDDYSILNDYLEEEAARRDPAMEDENLHLALTKLDSSRKIREGEQKILSEFACKQLEKKSKEEGGKSEDSEVSALEGSEDEEVVEKNVDKDLHFSDTDEELMNDELQRDKRKINSSSDEEEKQIVNRKKNKIESSNVLNVTECSSDVDKSNSSIPYVNLDKNCTGPSGSKLPES